MWWAFFTLLSCVTTVEHSYGRYVNNHVPAFVIGQPHRSAHWVHEPDIRVCADTKVSAFRINQAVSFWKKLGYKFGSIRMDPSPMCMRAYYGEILITLPESGFKNDQIASTRVYSRTNTEEIVKAKIFIMPKDSQKVRVLEHEIGHAIGWTHYNKKFHIMHSAWIYGGYDSSGLRNED